MIFLQEGGMNRTSNKFRLRRSSDFVVKLPNEVSDERRPAGGVALLRNEFVDRGEVI